MNQNDRESKIEQLKTLVSTFARNIDQYKSGTYDESNTRTDFIDKFFTLLDWDVANNNEAPRCKQRGIFKRCLI